MRMEHRRNHIIENLSIYILIVYSLSNLWGHLMAVELNSFTRLVITILGGVVVHILLSYPFITLLTFVLSIIPILILNRYQREFSLQFFSRVQQFMGNLNNYFDGTQAILSHNLTAFWVLITCCLCLLTWIILFKGKQPWLLIPIYIPIFIYYWYIYVDAAYPAMAVFLILYFILLGSKNYSKAEDKWRGKKTEYKQNVYPLWMKSSLMYGLVIVILATILPKGGNMVDWNWLEDRLVGRLPILIELRDDLVYSRSYGQGSLFDFSETGFQLDPLELGGPVRVSDRVVLEVKSPYSLYLRGNIKSIYENNRWEKGKISQRNYFANQSLPREISQGVLVELEITYINTASSTIFSPYQPTKISSETIGKFIMDQNYQLSQSGAIYKNEGYTVQSIIPTSKSISEDYKGLLGNTREAYLQLPEALSPKVLKLAEEITAGATTSYEKAELIRNYLRNNYVYTLEPTRIPKGKEFVEYFLFEEKEGYCTYFATSMAILLRTQGIPSRYVEGYRMPEESEDNVFRIRQNNAHAWIEAYIEPMGWIIFEATPAFQPPMIQGRSTTMVDDTDAQLYFDELEYLGILEGRRETLGNASPIEDPRGEVEMPQNSLQQDEIPKFINKLIDIMPKLIYTLLLGVLLLRIAFNHFRINRYYKRLKDQDSRISVPLIYQNLLDLLQEMGYPIQIGETPYEYTRRIMSRVHVNRFSFGQLTEIFVKVKFGGKEVEEGEVESLLEYLNLMDKKLRVQIGFWQYYYKKYVKGTIHRSYYF